jgi:hypothetical protein
MDGECRSHGIGEICIEYLGRKSRRKKDSMEDLGLHRTGSV